ncbi:MAG: AAC(3) family N-acetyltransferase, partial [Anaerolineales bacterium]
MISFRELIASFQQLGIERGRPVVVHASLSAFGEMRGGASTMVGALLAAFERVMMPAFTYKTMIIPEAGPPDNGIKYGSGKDTNRMAEFFRPDMPVDKLMGIISETLRQHPKSRRSNHPIFSFAGLGVDKALNAQTLANPLAPIHHLTQAGGWVLLLGVDHTVNTSIHYGEKSAGRKHFIRWALTPAGIRECPGFPGCSEEFNALTPHVEAVVRTRQVGNALVQAFPLPEMIDAIRQLIERA